MSGSSRMVVGQSHILHHPVGELRGLGGGADKGQKINTFETWLVKIGSSRESSDFCLIHAYYWLIHWLQNDGWNIEIFMFSNLCWHLSCRKWWYLEIELLGGNYIMKEDSGLVALALSQGLLRSWSPLVLSWAMENRWSHRETSFTRTLSHWTPDLGFQLLDLGENQFARNQFALLKSCSRLSYVTTASVS